MPQCPSLDCSQPQPVLHRRLFNLGGPDRLSRADMAEAVARAHGHDASLVQRVPAASGAGFAERRSWTANCLPFDCAHCRSVVQFRLMLFILQHIHPAAPLPCQDSVPPSNSTPACFPLPPRSQPALPLPCGHDLPPTHPS